MLFIKAVRVTPGLGGKVAARPVIKVVAVKISLVMQTMKGTPGVRAAKP